MFVCLHTMFVCLCGLVLTDTKDSKHCAHTTHCDNSGPHLSESPAGRAHDIHTPSHTSSKKASASDVNQLAIQFHEQYARQPDYKDYKKINNGIITDLQHQLGNQLCARLEFTGSGYEGTQIGPDVEFDVMMVRRRDGVTARKDPAHPGFAYLKDKAMIDLDPSVVMQKFKGKVQKALNKMNVAYGLKLRDHDGPAIQLDVSERGTLMYSVDLVPTYEIDGRFYVAKPLRDESLPDDQLDGAILSLWRDSASPQEKTRLADADRDNGCRKQVFRICKAVRVRQPNLKPALASVLLKNVLLKEMATRPHSDWKPGLQGERTLDVMRHLAKALDEGKLPKFFVPEMNLLQKMPPVVRGNMRDRLQRMVRVPGQLFA